MTSDWASFDVSRWMLAAVAFGALLAGGALAVERVQRIGRRSTRGVWAVALGVTVTWPLAAMVWLTRPAPLVSAGTGALMNGATAVVAAPESWRDVVRAWWSSHGDAFLLFLWLALAVVLLGQLLRALWRLHRAVRVAEPAQVLGDSVLVSESVGPAVFGVWRPRVVIPRWVLELDAPLQALVLRHEREHCDGRDSWLVWLAVLSTTLVPWNPTVWILAHRLRLAMEVDCDARTLSAFPERRTAYARLLLFIVQRAVPIRIAPALAHLPSHLSRRISAMTHDSYARPALQRALAGAMALGVFAAACSRPIAGNLAGPAPQQRPQPQAQPQSQQQAQPDASPSPRPSSADSAARANAPWFDFQVDNAVTMKAGAKGPRYPDALRAAKVEGLVLAQFVVGTDGRADMATFKVLKSDHDDFTASVREALVAMEFEPARVKGRPVKQLLQQPFVFNLAKGAPPASSTSVPATSPAASPAPNPGDHEARMLPNAPAPVYPAALREARVEGDLQIMVVVNADGTPDMNTFKVAKTDRAEFVDAVRAAVQNTRWDPAVKDGRAVRQLIQLPYAFRLAR